ncbi:hypothetical protein CHS0354_039827 [Potamilus streckersoni]|uniref:ubiquitinyl hydrolase 1 n=1 Tax=Potamilus streckersoni TaxID=2493646 RepID=A0AAE0RMA8_9BIVA|nr:hypothetical protein CHS0354_039827 [Potamilus streckersoni]
MATAKKSGLQQSVESYRFLFGTCPDEQCKAKLFFPAFDKSIECTGCGKRHEQSSLQNIAEVTNPGVAFHNLLKNILVGNFRPKKGTDSIKVLGLSNYVCKLISPILTTYGMDRKTGKARLLKEMGQNEVFDCGKILGDRAFLIEEENLDVIGYGRDRTGSCTYLSETLLQIKSFNDNEERLVPIHADGDGHCLVHAISRALVGHELFWHALRINLKNHFRANLSKYKEIFKDFVYEKEWYDIIDECDPFYLPHNGEPLGMRNIHIFGLANVLKRPIILLDSKEGMQSKGDYSGVFLPGLVRREDCLGKDGILNKPLCLAWSSSGRNHYIPLVGKKGRKQPMLVREMIQRTWGMPQDLLDQYIQFDKDGRCIIGGDKCLSDKYIHQLVSAMEEVFIQQNQVPPSLVADVHQYIYKSSGIVGVSTDEVLHRTQMSVQEKLLYRCLTCEALMEYHLNSEWFREGGALYELALEIYKHLDPTKLYSFPNDGVVCSYDKEKNVLIPDMKKSCPTSCAFCSGEMLRQVNSDGSSQYRDGDRTQTRSESGKCLCGFKHYWHGKEYDNLPEMIPITLQWGGKVISEKVAWFQYESDPGLNSNVYDVAQALVQKHFPGEFGSECLVQQVVDTILWQTMVKQEDDENKTTGSATVGQSIDQSAEIEWTPTSSSKIILTGHQHKAVHKEELTKSKKEKEIRQIIKNEAPKQQQKKTKELASMNISPKRVSTNPVKSEVKLILSDSKADHPCLPSSSSSQMDSQIKEKKIRLATSDGRQIQLSLVKDVTYKELQKLIFEALNVPVDQQKIRIGFPPRVLDPPEVESQIIPLQHGDKVSLEIILYSNITVDVPAESVHELTLSSTKAPKSSWRCFEEDEHSHTAENLLQILQNAQKGDSIDTSIASMNVMAALSGKDLWTYVQSMPHLFSVGGLFYNQMKRDLGLVHNKHCQLPTLSGKIFRYNANEGRLELCLEPYGHFPVEPDIENKVLRNSATGADSVEEECKPHFGMSGVIGHHGPSKFAFTGQGHSLKSFSEERMPLDTLKKTHTPHVRHFNNMSDPNKHQESIDEGEEDKLMEVDKETQRMACSSYDNDHDLHKSAPKISEVVYQRLGPAYSVIDQQSSNETNHNLEVFQALVVSIEKTLKDTMEDKDDTDSNVMQVSTFNVDNRLTSSVLSSSSIVKEDNDELQEVSMCQQFDENGNQASSQLSVSNNPQIQDKQTHMTESCDRQTHLHTCISEDSPVMEIDSNEPFSNVSVLDNQTTGIHKDQLKTVSATECELMETDSFYAEFIEQEKNKTNHLKVTLDSNRENKQERCAVNTTASEIKIMEATLSPEPKTEACCIEDREEACRRSELEKKGETLKIKWDTDGATCKSDAGPNLVKGREMCTKMTSPFQEKKDMTTLKGLTDEATDSKQTCYSHAY